MISKAIWGLGIAVMAGGCTLFGTPDAVQKVNQTMTSEDAVVTDLQNGHLEQTRALLLISRGTYECGDPKAQAAVNSPATSRGESDTQRGAAAKAALEVLNAYQNTLEAIVAQAKKKQAANAKVFANIQTAVGGLGSVVPAAAPFTLAASSAIAIISTAAANASVAITNEQMKDYAKGMKDILAVAVDTLKRNYDSFSGTGESAFKAWDSCARETLYYVRDIAGRGIFLKNGRRMDAFVAQPSGLELEGAWHAYRGKRAAFRGRLVTQQVYNQQLDDVIAQNNTLANGQQVSIDAAASTVSDLAAKAQKACEDFQKAAKQSVFDICKKSAT